MLGWARHRGWLDGRTLDMGAAPLAAGYAIGRIGCQLVRRRRLRHPMGRPVGDGLPERTVPTDVPVHPTPVYETLIMGAVVVLLWRWRHRFRPGTLFALWPCSRAPSGS